jgi:peptidoglycan/LPS O-acetylase OafA/YrhL
MPTGAVTLPPTHRDQAFSGWLDLFRGAAALAVLYGHGRSLFLQSLTPEAPGSLGTRVMYFLAGYGHAAVMVFFVLSGFLVGGTVIRAVREDRWSWGRYALQRATRLYIVLVPTLFLTLAWDSAEQFRSSGLSPNNDTAVANIRSETIRENTSAAIFAGNLAFLQTVLVPPLGSNTPLWSLANEFWYYVLFPLIWLAVAPRPGRFARRLLLLLSAGALLFLLGTPISLYFIIWLLGTLVWFAPEWSVLQRQAPRRAITLLATCGFLATLVGIRLNRTAPEFAKDLAIAIAFAGLLYCMKHNRVPAASSILRRGTATLADFSYSLYLAHLPPLIFLRACLTYETAWPASAETWIQLFLILAAAVAYSYLIFLLAERHTDRLRRWLERFVQSRATNRARPATNPAVPAVSCPEGVR